jgi:hypothetical protein
MTTGMALLWCCALLQQAANPSGGPRVGAFDPSAWPLAVSPAVGRQGNYRLVSPVSTGAWVICAVECTADAAGTNAIKGTTVKPRSLDAHNDRIEQSALSQKAYRCGLVAINVKTLRVQQLLTCPGRAKGRYNAVTGHYSITRDVCAVVTTAFAIDSGVARSLPEQQLWLWRVSSAVTCSAGRYSMAALLQVFVDAKRESICAPSLGAAAPCATLIDEKDERQLLELLRRPELLQSVGMGFQGIRRHGDTIIPQANRDSVVVYQRAHGGEEEPDRVSQVLCYDLRSPRRIRWTVTSVDIERIVDGRVHVLYPVRGRSPESRELILAIAVADPSERFGQALAVLDVGSGRVKRSVRLSDRAELSMRGLLSSADCSLSCYVSDSGPHRGRRDLVMVDMQAGAVVSETDVTTKVAVLDEIFGIEDQTHLLVRAGNTICRVVIGDPVRVDKLFTFDVGTL